MLAEIERFSALIDAVSFAFGMFWEILWALILGFALSGAVQAVVSKGEMRRLLPDDSPRTLSIACGFGAASSSCSYAAVALARSLFRRGANFTASMAFQFASTNLVIELGIIIALLLGWQFTLAEFVGGPLMIVLLAIVFRFFLRRRLVEEARVQSDRGMLGKMEGHAEMDMSVARKPRHVAKFWGPVIGPVVAIISFVCSIGNVPLAAVLWNGGAAMVGAGLIVEFVFDALGLIPSERNAKVVEASVSWNYTTFLNIVFLTLAALLVWRYFRHGGGLRMLRMMDEPMGHGTAHGHAH